MKRVRSLELVILGILSEFPTHGYELRKKVPLMLGSMRAVSFGSLYPELRRLEAHGYVKVTNKVAEKGLTRRSRISYAITKKGEERFTQLMEKAGPESWDDFSFNTYLAFFSRVATNVRMQILQGRHTRLQEKIATMKRQLDETKRQLDEYGLRLHTHNIDSLERELKWIEGLIVMEGKVNG